MDQQHEKIAMVKELRVGLLYKEQEVVAHIAILNRGDGARELALARTALQEARHWVEESLCELGLGWSYNTMPVSVEGVGNSHGE